MRTAFGALRLCLAAFLPAVICIRFVLGPALAQQPQHVPGTSVSLVPMAGFTPSTGLAGFVSSDGGAIMITEMPAEAYEQVMLAIRNPGKELVPLLASQGVKLDKIEGLTTESGEQVPLLSGTQGPLDKWMALFNGTKAAWVIVQSPRASNREGAVKKMMASVTLGRPATQEEQIAALPFTAIPAPPFRFGHTLSGLSVGLTIGDKNIDPDDVQPWIIISYEPQPAPNLAELDRLVEARLVDARQFVEARIETRQAVKFAGFDGTLFIGTYEGQVGKPRRPKYVLRYQAIADSGRTIGMSVIVDKEAFGALKPAIEAVARSIAVKPGN